MRVLHVTSFYEPSVAKGGLARAVGLLATSQARQGTDVTVFTTSVGLGGAESSLTEEVRDGVRVWYFAAESLSGLYFSYGLLRSCFQRTRQFDLVHVHGLWSFPATCGAMAARWAKVPYLVSSHGMLNSAAMNLHAYKKLPFWFAIQRRTLRRAAWLHFATLEEQRQAATWIRGKKACVIPIGLNLREFREPSEPRRFRSEQGIPADVALLAFVGRIHPLKALDVLLHALVRVVTQVPQLIVAIAGPDENGHRDRLQKLARKLGIDAQVRWLGTLVGQAKLDLLTDADVFVLPSFSENLGLAALEAMALGCPVILGCGVNIAADVKRWGAGRVVSPEPDALAMAIIELLENPGIRSAMRQAGRRLVAGCFDADTLAREMLRVYEECLR